MRQGNGVTIKLRLISRGIAKPVGGRLQSILMKAVSILPSIAVEEGDGRLFHNACVMRKLILVTRDI